jgi:hypothetical protein
MHWPVLRRRCRGQASADGIAREPTQFSIACSHSRSNRRRHGPAAILRLLPPTVSFTLRLQQMHALGVPDCVSICGVVVSNEDRCAFPIIKEQFPDCTADQVCSK